MNVKLKDKYFHVMHQICNIYVDLKPLQHNVTVTADKANQLYEHTSTIFTRTSKHPTNLLPESQKDILHLKLGENICKEKSNKNF